MKKILFINFGGLGDEILFLPAIISVKKEFPDAEITLALEPRSKGIISLSNVIDKTLFADIKGKHKYFQLFKLLINIWSKRFDIVISSGSNKFISVFLFLTLIKKKIGYNTGKISQLLLSNAIELNKNQYAASMYHDLVTPVTQNKTSIPQINIEKRTTKPNTVLIHPGVSLLSVNKKMIKTVPAKVWAEVVNKLAESGKTVILAGGPDDKNVIEYIQNNVQQDKYTNMYGKTKNLKELAELISESEIFLCSDSAPLHIGVALGVKTFVIFGSTDDKKLIPHNKSVIPIKSQYQCPLQPCLWERRQTTCDTLQCLKISSDEIVKMVLDNN